MSGAALVQSLNPLLKIQITPRTNVPRPGHNLWQREGAAKQPTLAIHSPRNMRRLHRKNQISLFIYIR